MMENKNWKDIVTIINGKNQRNVLNPEGKYPIYGSGGIIGFADDYLCEAGTTIIGRKGTINSPIFVNEKFWNVDTAFGICPGKELNPLYLFYFCQSFNFKELDKSTTIPSLSKTDLLNIEMPVPPLAEQERIVSRIEELFSQLDAGVETLKKTKAQLEVYRQAVLKDAFDRIAEQAIETEIKNVCKEVKVGIVIKPSSFYTENGIRAFRSANVKEFHVNDNDWVYLTKEGHEHNSRSEVHTGDVLIVRSGYPGTACVVTEKYDSCNAIDILIAVPNTNIVISDYLCAYTNSPHGRTLVREKKRGVAQAHLNVGAYSKMKILLPSLKLQIETVNYINDKLSVCDSIEKTVDEALQQAEAMRQSILKQAFGGKI